MRDATETDLDQGAMETHCSSTPARAPVEFQNMSSGNTSGDKARFAIGLFYRVPDLERAVRELEAADLPLHRMMVMAPHEEVQADTLTWRACAADLDIEILTVAGASDLRASDPASAKRSRTVTAADGKCAALRDFRLWTLERHARQLDRHLQEGGAIIVVEFTTESEERAAYSTLLRHATAGVQTHEISRHQ